MSVAWARDGLGGSPSAPCLPRCADRPAMSIDPKSKSAMSSSDGDDDGDSSPPPPAASAPPSPPPPAENDHPSTSSPSSQSQPSLSQSSQSPSAIEVHLRIRPSANPSTYHSVDDLNPSTLIFNVPSDLRSSDHRQHASNSSELTGKNKSNKHARKDEKAAAGAGGGLATSGGGGRGGYVNNSRTRYAFAFDSILPPGCAQSDVFTTVGRPAVQNALEGYNSTIFAYGQTGSGKTFTITGGPERYDDRGIVPRALSMLFDEFGRRRRKAAEGGDGTVYSCYVSYLELYNECGYDLLARDSLSADQSSTSTTSGGGEGKSSSLLSAMTGSSSSSSSSGGVEDGGIVPKVTMLEDEDGNYHFRNLSIHPVASEEDALNLLFLGDTNRAIGETEMNQSSSRSHCIFTVMIEGRRAGSDTVVRSKLNLVDLAGSERVHKTSSTGQTLSEAKYINSSLFFLEMVIVALHERTKRGRSNTHVPYRNSMMTSVLRDSLGGNCKTVMIATISPEAAQVGESISTCQFAQRVALVKNSAEINEELEPAVVIQRLRGEVGRLREEVKYLKGENGEGDVLTEEQRNDLERRIQEYVNDGDLRSELDIGSMTLTKIQSAYSIFKGMVLEARKNGTGGGGSTIRSRNSVVDDGTRALPKNNGHEDNDNLQEQVDQLERTLQRRDHEIAILVDMVKQKGLAPRASRQVSHLFEAEERDESDQAAEIGSPTDGATAADAAVPPKAIVCGVKRCRDQAVLDEPSKAFDWFRDRYPGVAAIEENKKELKAKYSEAKDIGEVVQKSRSSINHHKSSIEQMRRDRAMEGLASGEGFDQEGIMQPHPDEQVHREAIEREKKTYKDGFSRLKELKSQIEHIQMLVEKNRAAMQRDFGIWYREMCGERQDSVGAYGRMTRRNKSSAMVGRGNTMTVGKREEGTKKGSSRGSEYPRLVHHQTPEPTKDAEHVKEDKEASDDFELPPGVKLTGNKDVDDDIIDFYKAKKLLQINRSL